MYSGCVVAYTVRLGHWATDPKLLFIYSFIHNHHLPPLPLFPPSAIPPSLRLIASTLDLPLHIYAAALLSNFFTHTNRTAHTQHNQPLPSIPYTAAHSAATSPDYCPATQVVLAVVRVSFIVGGLSDPLRHTPTSTPNATNQPTKLSLALERWNSSVSHRFTFVLSMPPIFCTVQISLPPLPPIVVATSSRPSWINAPLLTSNTNPSPFPHPPSHPSNAR